MAGNPISRQEINDDVKKYVQLQAEILPLLTAAISPEAKNYYEAKEISFLFEKQGLDDLFAANPTADALRVYYASHNDGTPSVILVAARIIESDKPQTSVINMIDADDNAGYQWPSRIKMQTADPANFDIISDNG